MNKRALITGATGFTGSNLARKLLNHKWKVDVIVRPSSNMRLISDVQNNLTVFEFDGDTENLINIVSKSSPDIVIHIASLILSEHRSDQVESLIRSNVLFGTQLLEAMSIVGVRSLINTSTFWEHYEGNNYNPVNLYAATKHAFGNILKFYVEAKQISAITLKLFDTYGPNDPRPKLLNLLLRAAETGEPLAMSPGEQQIDLVHIDDVVQAYTTAAQRLLDGKVNGHESYGVTSGNPISLKELVALLEKQIGKKINIAWGKRPYRTREVMQLWSREGTIDGWSPKIKLIDRLRQLICEIL